MAVEADVQGILCHSNVLLSAPPALYQVHSALGLAGSRCAHLVGSFGDSTLERVGGLDVSASNTAFGVTWPVSIPDTFGDEDRHFHPYIPFFFTVVYLEEEKDSHKLKTWSQLGYLHPSCWAHTDQRLGHNWAICTQVVGLTQTKDLVTIGLSAPKLLGSHRPKTWSQLGYLRPNTV